MCSGFVIAWKTSASGASNSRVMRISRSEGVVTVNVPLFATLLTGILLLLFFQCLQVGVEAIQARFPDGAVPLGPFGDFLDRRRIEAAGPPLRLASARDEAGALEHAQVLRHGRHAHLERLGQF